MKIKEILKIGNENLIENGIEESKLKTKILLSNIMDVSKEYLLIHDEQNVSKEVEDEFFEKLNRLSKNEPLQYVINKSEFMKMEFYVDKRVLIPQPDTEILVEKVIELCKTRKNKRKILDLCTGSGIICVSLAKNLEFLDITATDISDDALEVAKINSLKNNANVKFIKSDLFENISEKFDLIVSNPPYIETDTINLLSKEVQSEPVIALDGGKDGLDFYRKISKESKEYLNENGVLALEIGYNQKNSVIEILKNNNYKNIECFKDLAGNDRVIICEKNN